MPTVASLSACYWLARWFCSLSARSTPGRARPRGHGISWRVSFCRCGQCRPDLSWLPMHSDSSIRPTLGSSKLCVKNVTNRHKK
ncbi:hypothetical protein [Lysobacter gummosus]|uniref:hypothetical protein n=1 Tax=Lysobacter gummosus TaxID=262324 RepID=UPI00362C9C5E